MTCAASVAAVAAPVAAGVAAALFCSRKNKKNVHGPPCSLPKSEPENVILTTVYRSPKTAGGFFLLLRISF